MKHYVGIDIGGMSIKYGLLDEAGTIITKGICKTSTKGKEIIAAIKKIVQDYQKDHEIEAVGVSVPGIVEASGYMTTGGAIADFYGIHLREILEHELKLLVTVENDANSAALAEKWRGAGRNYSNFFTVVVGTGIGGGIVINDTIYRGAHATAGEFGFMLNKPIENNDTRRASLSLTGAVRSGLIHPYQEITGSSAEIDGKEIFERATKGDEVADQVIDAFYHYLAVGIYNVLVSFDPEVVLVGGGISANPAFISELNNRIKKLQAGHRDMANMTLSSVLPCHFLNDAGIVGATYKATIAVKERATKIG